MEDVIAKAFGVLIDKGGAWAAICVSLAAVAFLAARAYMKAKDAHVADLLKIIPTMDALTAAAQASAASDAKLDEAIKQVGTGISEIKTLVTIAIATKGARE